VIESPNKYFCLINNLFCMKRFAYTMLMVLFCTNLFAQKDFFIFIQQASGQPFYVRLGEKSFSSSSGGHIILPGLQDSVYSLYLGFPKNTITEQLFPVPVKHKDRGFELKNMNGEWQLFDLQSLQFIKSVPAMERAAAVGTKKNDSYSQLMAGVVDDSAVLYSTAAKKEEIKGGNTVVQTQEVVKVIPAVKKETPVPQTRDTIVQVPVTRVPVVASRDIIRFGSENVEDGKLIIYIDRTTPVSDTIRIIIPRL
jgi:hypothetical protein